MQVNISTKNNPLSYVYEIVVAPDALNDLESPETIVKRFINNDTSKAKLK